MKKAVLLSLCLFFFFSAKSQSWLETQKEFPPSTSPTANFGYSISIDNTFAIIGSYREDITTAGGQVIQDGGAAYIYELDSTNTWHQVQKLVGSQMIPGSSFGFSVSISGAYALVSAINENRDTSGINTTIRTGAAYLFERDSSGYWNEVKRLVASDAAPYDFFGFSVAIHGNTAMVGAQFEDEDANGGNTKVLAGSVYVFERESDNWIQIQKIVPDDRAEGDGFGETLSIDGNKAVVGVTNRDDDANGNNPLATAGAAYIFERNLNGTWSQAQKIVPFDREAGDHFGNSVSISGDEIIIGAFAKDDSIPGVGVLYSVGTAYIFKRDALGTWNQTTQLFASDKEGDNFFGRSVSISGEYALVGASREGEEVNIFPSLKDAGAAYLYKKDATGIWNEEQKLIASDRALEDYFGYSVSITDNYAIVGALGEDGDSTGGTIGNDAGSIYFFNQASGLGISKDELVSHFQVYPNPTNNTLFVTSEEVQKNVMITIRNMMGQVVSTQHVDFLEKMEINLEGPAGMYLLEIQTDDTLPVTVKVVKR